MENNKDLRTSWSDTHYVIVADRDNVRKYISGKFPSLFAHTVKLNKAKRFYSEENASEFIRKYNGYDRVMIINPEIRTVQKCLMLI